MPARRLTPIETQFTSNRVPDDSHAHASIKSAPSRPMDCSGTGSGSSAPRKIARPFATGPGSSPADLEGKVVLDAGCGMGRYLRIAAESSASLIVGLDLSHAVVAARELTAGSPDVGVVRGDLLRLPFAAGELRPDLLAGRARPHARPPRGVPRAGPALEARRPDRHLGLPARAGRRRMDHERPACHFDPSAARPARTPLPVGRADRRPQAEADGQPMAADRAHWASPCTWRPSASRCIPIPRSACATRSTGTLPGTCRGIPSTKSPAGSATPD